MRRILIVEDDPDLRELLAYELTHEGFGVAAAGLAPRLCGCASGRRPTWCCSTSCCRLFGARICRALRRAPETEDVPIIFLTACGADADRIQGLEVGADDYVSKPFQMRELTLRIQALLRRTDPRAAAPPSLVSDRVVRREQLRVWEGFAANHMGRVGVARGARDLARDPGAVRGRPVARRAVARARADRRLRARVERRPAGQPDVRRAQSPQIVATIVRRLASARCSPR